MLDMASHSAPQHDIDGRRHTMSISLVEAALQEAGVPRSHRHVIRLCKSGALQASKYPGASGEEWLVAPDSVPKVIGDLRALDEARARRSATQPNMSEHVAVEVEPKKENDTARHSAPQRATSELQPRAEISETQPDTPRQGSETEPVTSHYVTQLEKRIAEKDDVISILRGELANRNEELVRRNERERETNVLIRGLQNLVLRLQPGTPHDADVLRDDPIMSDGASEPTR
jgi:hypothetical protein